MALSEEGNGEVSVKLNNKIRYRSMKNSSFYYRLRNGLRIRGVLIPKFMQELIRDEFYRQQQKIIKVQSYTFRKAERYL